MSFGARAVVRLGAIRHNLDTIKARVPGARVMAVIKANAYGHGMLPVARCLDAADCLAVGRLQEAADLRAAGIEMPIALLGGVVSEADLASALELRVQLGVHSTHQVEWLERMGAADATVWLKIDTGMNRLGFRVHEAATVIERLRACAAVADLKLMTHLANAERVDDDTSARQMRDFAGIADSFDGDISIGNSAGIFAWDRELQNVAADRRADRVWVRPGLTLYGISPFADTCGTELGLEPAMQFESRLVTVKALQQGEPVGYGGTWRADRDTVLGIIAVGYGDGYSRYIPSGTPVVVNERRVPVAGAVSMDLTAVDLGPGATDRPGDPVLLWGDGLPVEEIAAQAGTIPYQLVCGVMDREERVFEK